MLNLIRRDVILQKRLLLTFVPFIAFFIIMGAHPVMIFLVAGIFVPFNAFAYDEKAQTHILLNSLPYTRKEIIASRYLGAIVYMVSTIGVTSIALIVFDKPFSLTDVAMAGGLFVVFAALTFPLFYIFKPGFITPIVLFGFIFLTLITGPVTAFISNNLTAITDIAASLSVTTMYTGAAVMIVTLYAASWGLTTFIYQRKVL